MTDHVSGEQRSKDKGAAVRAVLFLIVVAAAGFVLASAMGVFPPLYRSPLTCESEQGIRMAGKIIADHLGAPEQRVIIHPNSTLDSQDGWTRCIIAVSEAGTAEPPQLVQMRLRRSDDGGQVLVNILPLN
jgi:hypothetical protein